MNVPYDGESRQQEQEAAGHVKPVVREQRKVSTSLLSSSPSPFLQFREMVLAMIGEPSHLFNIIKTAPDKGLKGYHFQGCFFFKSSCHKYHTEIATKIANGITAWF